MRNIGASNLVVEALQEMVSTGDAELIAVIQGKLPNVSTGAIAAVLGCIEVKNRKEYGGGYATFAKLLEKPISRADLIAGVIKQGQTESTAKSYIAWAKRVVDEERNNPFFFEIESYSDDHGVQMLRKKPGRDFTHEDPLGDKPVKDWVGR